MSLCTELASLERYYEYVCYAFVAYPALLFQEPCMEVLRMVTNSRLVVELCRDIVSHCLLAFALCWAVMCVCFGSTGGMAVE